MRLIKLKETVTKPIPDGRSRGQRSFRAITRKYFANEALREFAIETLLFVIIVAIAAWPIVAAAHALREFLGPAGV